jgi:hypothetical protein
MLVQRFYFIHLNMALLDPLEPNMLSETIIMYGEEHFFILETI